jgi:hypothetical protein
MVPYLAHAPLAPVISFRTMLSGLLNRRAYRGAQLL